MRMSVNRHYGTSVAAHTMFVNQLIFLVLAMLLEILC